MDERLIALCDYLRETMDPDEIVELLGLDSDILVDALTNVIDDWMIENDWRPEDV